MMAATVVIMIGRKRITEASWIACSGLRPEREDVMAKSIIMMPFFLTMPIRRIRPM
jgi:hypothetical protein